MWKNEREGVGAANKDEERGERESERYRKIAS